MLTKQEREEIAGRLKKCTCMIADSAYKALFNKEVPSWTTWQQDSNDAINRILDLCDTSNMIELPRDKDGIPFKMGDTVYESDGTEHIVDGYAFSRANAKIVSVVDLINNTRILFETDELTHKRPVTIASVRKQLKHVLDKGEMTSWSMAKLFDIADQLEMLSDSDD
jgi:hypothetical protein